MGFTGLDLPINSPDPVVTEEFDERGEPSFLFIELIIALVLFTICKDIESLVRDRLAGRLILLHVSSFELFKSAAWANMKSAILSDRTIITAEAAHTNSKSIETSAIDLIRYSPISGK